MNNQMIQVLKEGKKVEIREKEIQELMKQFDLMPATYPTIKQAFFHSSYTNELRENIDSNERLEFLGDGVLNLILAHFLYQKFPHLPEGELTKKRAQIVREEALVIYAKSIELPSLIYLGKGEEKTGGRKRPAIIADCFEAFIGSIFLSHGFDFAQDVLLEIVIPIFEKEELENVTDYKSMFQEYIQVDPNKKIKYEVKDEIGQPHDRLFIVEVYVDDNSYGLGEGRTKKEAEQRAAYAAIKKMVK